MGAVIMLGTLFGLIVLIFGLVLRYDPEARRSAKPRARPMSHALTPLLTASIGFAYVGRARVRRNRRVPHVSPPPPPPAPARLHRGDLDLLDRGALRLGGVRAVRSGHPPHAVVVAVGHDLGWAACVGARRLHLVFRDACPGRRRSRAMAELEVPLAQADHPPHRRARRRLSSGPFSSTGSWVLGSASSTTAG